MPTQDKLEIIGPKGDVLFYNLDIEQGVTNIGRDPANDIVLDDADIALFQAIVDHRQKPYQLTVLSNKNEITVEGESLGVSEPKTLQNWANITIGDFTLILVEEVETTATQHPDFVTTSPGGSVIPAVPSQVEATPVYMPPKTVPISPILSLPEEDMFVPTGLLNRFTTRPHDEEDEVIITELSENQWQVDVEQMSTCQLTIVNGGDIVAAFEVGVQGLDPSWVVISEPYVNLFEGERATITLTITPPHAPTSRAGGHHFAIIVTSPNYPGRMSRRGATLTINPYYEFSVEELSPKRQTLSWSKRSGQVTLPINNMGNSATPFRLEGADDERACNFEFDVPGETIALATQAELRLYPEESIAVPIRVTPLSRRLIAFRKRSYPYTITTSLIEGQQTSRSMLGELSHKPLIGPWILLLMGLILTTLLLILARPRLNLFMFDDGGQVKNIRNGTPVAIQWEASFFTTDRTLEANPDSIDGLEGPIALRGSVETYPKENTTYTLIGGNILSRFAPAIFPPPISTIQVRVNPIAPNVTFEVQPEVIIGENEITLSWNVDNADKIELFRQVGADGREEFIGDYSGQNSGVVRVTPEPGQDSMTYILKASNAYMPTSTPAATRVSVYTPTAIPTQTPTPSIAFFTANPPTIAEGEGTTLRWRVNGVEVVTIEGLDSTASLPAEHTIEVWPTVSTDYILIVPDAPELQPMTVRVDVLPATATPTPVPGAPEISFFVADEDEIVKGDSTDVTLTWSIVGTTTNVELSSAELPNPLSNLQNDGAFTISLDDTALFVLTAFNGPAKASRTVQIDTKEPTPTSPPPTPPILPVILEFTAKPLDTVTTCSGSFRVQMNWKIRPPLAYIELWQDDKTVGEGTPEELHPGYVTTVTLTSKAAPRPAFTLKAFNETYSEPVESQPVVVDLPPVAVDDLNVSTPEGTPVTIDVAANDCDPPALAPLTNYSLSIVSGPLPGNMAILIENNTKIQYTPTGEFNGQDSFTYSLCDSANQCDTATVNITVNPVNDPPVANPDNYQILEDMPLMGNVLDNDTDVDGDSLTASIVPPGPTNGSIPSITNGSFTYTPNSNYCGLDSFTYTVSDGNGGTDTATVTIEVTCVNDGPPVLTVDNPTLSCSLSSPPCTNTGTVMEPADIEEKSVTLSTSIGTVNSPVGVNTPTPGDSGSWTWENTFTATDSIQVTIVAEDSQGLTFPAFFWVTVVP